MRIRLQPYDFTIKYKPGKELILADALSTSYLEEEFDSFDKEIGAHVGLITENICIAPDKRKLFQNATKDDEELQIISTLIKMGWTNNTADEPDKAKKYFHFKEELSETDGLIFKNSYIVVPKSLRKMMLEKIHYNHMGIEKCKSRVREILLWPGMSKEIEDLVRNCSTCLKYQKHNAKEPLMPKHEPFSPWEILGTDLF